MDFKEKLHGYLNQTNPVTTRFLTQTEQTLLQNVLSKKAGFVLFGGYEHAERKRAAIHTEELPLITAFKIQYHSNYLRLTHQNILGTLLSLNISLDSIGDILPKQDAFLITSEMKDFVRQELTEISGHSVTLEEIDPTSLKNNQEYITFTLILDSLRLDLVVSKIAKISRNKAKEMIEKELVKVNHLNVTKTTIKIDSNDILSIRKSGRFIIDDTSKRSKKGKIIAIIRKYN